MASRPIFSPKASDVGVKEELIDFKWFPGLATSQKKKSINPLHEAARTRGYPDILEISSKSENRLGVELSAFNLIIKTKKYGNRFTVESAFQGSKVFEKGGPYKDLFSCDSLKAKKDVRLKESGDIIGFSFFGMKFPTTPLTYFYDWLYINALNGNQELAEEVKSYGAFSDIEFNPKRSINCQAHAVALFISLEQNKQLSQALEGPSQFLRCTLPHYEQQSRNLTVQRTFI